MQRYPDANLQQGDAPPLRQPKCFHKWWEVFASLRMDAVARIMACRGGRWQLVQIKWASKQVDKGTFVNKDQTCPEQGSAEAN